MTHARPRLPRWLVPCACLLAWLGSIGDAPAERARERAAEDPPAHFVALGVRALAHDPTSLAIAGKARLRALGRASVGARGALLFGGYPEARLSITAELAMLPRVSMFAGAGVAYGTDGLRAFDPLLTGGFHVRLVRHIAIDLSVNYIFQLEAGDDDKEFVGALALVL